MAGQVSAPDHHGIDASEGGMFPRELYDRVRFGECGCKIVGEAESQLRHGLDPLGCETGGKHGPLFGCSLGDQRDAANSEGFKHVQRGKCCGDRRKAGVTF